MSSIARSPRRASVLAFVTSQLLHSHRSIIAKTKFADSQPREIIFDMPRPQRDWPDPANPPDDCKPARDRVPMAWTIPPDKLDPKRPQY
jgi:hypothetical protein